VWNVVGVVVVHDKVMVLMPAAVVTVTILEAEPVAVAVTEPEALAEEEPEAEILKGFEYWKIAGLLTSLMTRP
jgi:hypothetical protein